VTTLTCRLKLLLYVLFAANSAHGAWLHYGECQSEKDPAVSPPELVSMCVNGKVAAWFVHKSNRADRPQPDVLYRAQGDLSLFVTPWISGTVTGHSSLFVSRDTMNTTLKDARRDGWQIQIGNNALSRHRASVGRGKPVFRINHQLHKEIFYAWGLDLFEAPEVDYVTYVYDNQLDWTINATYGQLIDRNLSTTQRMFASGRLMYDIAALEGTRIVVGGYSDGLVNRSVSLGLININGRNEQTSIEITRNFSHFPYDPDEFRQNIRIAHLTREQDKTQLRFQYDDFFRLVRIGGVGLIYRPAPLVQLEFEMGYAKHEDMAKRSHWYVLGSSGVSL